MNAPATGDIADLVARLWSDIDHHGGESAHHYFTEDAVLRFDARAFTGRRAIAKVYADRRARGPRLSRHLISNLIVDRTGADEVGVHHVSTLYAVDGVGPGATTVPTAVADVFDTFRQAGGPDGWLIAERTWHTVFIAPDTELAVPTK